VNAAGQTILVTGATDGLGRAVAAKLAAQGSAVLLHGRDDERGRQTINAIHAQAPDAELHWYRADLASLAEVNALADRIAADHPRIDGVLSNAGIGTVTPGDGKRMESADGHELRFAVNYLAGYLLIRRLLPALRRSEPSRIVQVSSAGQAPIDFGDLMLEHNYRGVQAYCQSKLAHIMFTIDLAQELDGSAVSATCLHPGTYMPTKIVLGAGVHPVTALEDGVAATLRLLAAPELDGVSGVYFDGHRESAPHPQALHPDARQLLRELSDGLCMPFLRPPTG
jgi:NAD(P)-dependent dehydrogenase (short-subunit alcohol dehydrogenase family)